MEKLKTLWLKLQKLIKREAVKMDVPVWNKSVEVLYNKDFISIRAYSGDGLYMVDPEAEEYLLEPSISNEILGESVLKSLKQSRFLEDEEFVLIHTNCQENYEAWVEKIKKLYGYKTRKAMFKKMNRCSIECDNTIILIEPFYHEKIEAWSGMKIQRVKIPADSSPEEIGAALRLAFSRCKSKTF